MNIRNILITGGRAPATLELIRLLAISGHRIIVAESTRHHISRFSKYVSKNYFVQEPRYQTKRYIDDLINIITKESIDMLIPTCEETFYIAMNKNILSSYCNALVDSIDKIKELHNKWSFSRTAVSKGMFVPKTYIVHSTEEMTSVLDKYFKSSYLVVIKPVYSRFASRTQILNSARYDISHNHISTNDPWVVQEYIAGEHICTYSLAHQGNITLHTSYVSTCRVGIGAGIAFEYKEQPAIFQLISSFVQNIVFTGQISFDFIIDDNGQPFVIECNPRLTSGIHLFENRDQIDSAFFTKNTDLIKPSIHQRKMLLLPMLAASFFYVTQFSIWLTAVRKSKDVVFRLSDPLPFFHQILILIVLIIKSIQHKASLTEVTTIDIEWNGTP